MDNTKVALNWAKQRISHSKGHNMFFEDDTIYSYGHHFPIAKWCFHYNQKVILFTTRGYSVTTARHISEVRYAISKVCPNVKVYYVDSVNGFMSEENNVNVAKKSILDAIEVASRARTRFMSEIRDIRGEVKNLLDYLSFIGKEDLKIKHLGEKFSSNSESYLRDLCKQITLMGRL